MLELGPLGQPSNWVFVEQSFVDQFELYVDNLQFVDNVELGNYTSNKDRSDSSFAERAFDCSLELDEAVACNCGAVPAITGCVCD